MYYWLIDNLLVQYQNASTYPSAALAPDCLNKAEIIKHQQQYEVETLLQEEVWKELEFL